MVELEFKAAYFHFFRGGTFQVVVCDGVLVIDFIKTAKGKTVFGRSGSSVDVKKSKAIWIDEATGDAELVGPDYGVADSELITDSLKEAV